MSFVDMIKNRRSIYALGKNVAIGQDEINALVKECVAGCPSAMNSQTSKAVILYGDKHEELWSLLKEKMRGILPPDALGKTLEKIEGFNGAYATILYFENMQTVESLEQNFPLYAHNFKNWSQQASGMLQFAVWTGLREMGLGASIQHYNELIEEDVRRMFGVEEKYKLISQMPFGNIVQLPDEKEISNMDERFCVVQ